MVQRIQTVTTNLGGGHIRYSTLHGRRHLIVPVAMMKQGVWAGSDGPLLYTGRHLANSCPSWNNKPIVASHPKHHGKPVSAGDPDVLGEVEIGRVLRARFSNHKQRAEAWLDEDRVREVDPRILEKLENGEMVEVSTGLFVDQKEREGVYNGKAYKAVATNHRPDHLAVLMDEEGACSIKDGAGLLQANAKRRSMQDANIKAMKMAASRTNKKMKSLADKRKKSKSTNNHKRTTAMAFNKRVVVDEIITNGVFLEKDRDWLLTLNERKLGAIIAPYITANEEEDEDFELESEELDEIEDTEDEDTEDEDTEDSDDDDVEEEEYEANAKKKFKKGAKAGGQTTGAAPPTKKGGGGSTPKGGVPVLCESEEDYLAALPASIREVHALGLQTLNSKKAEFIHVITANKGNRFSKKQLNGFELDELEALAGLAMGGAAGLATNGRRFAPNFAGAQGGAMIANASGLPNTKPYVMPTINFRDSDDDSSEDDDEE
jgi:hypothetical protein